VTADLLVDTGDPQADLVATLANIARAMGEQSA
jgi:hypothetical protein